MATAVVRFKTITVTVSSFHIIIEPFRTNFMGNIFFNSEFSYVFLTQLMSKHVWNRVDNFVNVIF